MVLRGMTLLDNLPRRSGPYAFACPCRPHKFNVGFLCRKTISNTHSFFCNIDIQNSQMCKDIHFPYILKGPLFLVSIPQILGVYLTILLTIESTKFEANMFGLAFLLIQVQRTW